MGVQHLDGRRTGRPRGTRSTPQWQRDMLWVARHLGTDTVPPSPGARLWSSFATAHPDRFIACIIQLGTQEAKTGSRSSDRPEAAQAENRSAGVTGATNIAKPRRQHKTLTLKKDRFQNMLLHQRASVPSDSKVVSVVEQGDKVIITLFSETFPLVPDGQAVPELAPKYG